MQKAERTNLDDVLLLDMDGTVADYERAMLDGLNALRAPGEPPAKLEGPHPPHIVERMQLIKSQPGWWRALRPRKLGFDVYHEARKLGFIVHVLTRGPWSTPSAWTEKVQWCREHFGEDVGVTITEDKGLVYGRVLVDDHPDYCAQWLRWRPRGLVVMPATKANAGVQHPQIIRYDGSNLPAVRERMRAVCRHLER